MILLRGYDHNKRISEKIKYEPKLYVSTNRPTNWKALDGTPVGETIRLMTNMEIRKAKE